MEQNEFIFSVCSSTPVQRETKEFGIYNEVLTISNESINFERIKSGHCSFLKDHDSTIVLGVITDAWIQDNKLQIKVKFSSRPEVQGFIQDIKDGIYTNTSIGYEIEKYHFEIDSNNIKQMIIDKFMPYEASLVGVPADNNVGFKRTMESTLTNEPNTQAPIDEETKEPDTQKVEETTNTPSKEPENTDTLDENSEIENLGEITNQRNLAKKFISEHRSLAEFKNTLRLLNNSHEDNTIMEKSFSISKAIRNNMSSYKGPISEYEDNIINENKRSLGIGNEYDVVVKQSNLRALAPTAGLGAELIGTQYMPGLFTKLDRPESIIAKTGCTSIPVDGTPISFATVTSGCVASMVDLDGNLPDTDLKFATKEMKARKVGAVVPIPYSLILQAKPEIDAIVTEDLLGSIEQKKDEMILIGSGSNGEPTGLFNTADVNTTTVTAWDLKTAFSFEQPIREANIDTDHLCWVMNAKNYFTLAATPKSATELNEFLINDDKKMIGYPVYICNALADNQVALGDFSELLVANYDGVMLKVDDITYIKKQALQIVAFEAFDCIIRKPKAFTISK